MSERDYELLPDRLGRCLTWDTPGAASGQEYHDRSHLSVNIARKWQVNRPRGSQELPVRASPVLTGEILVDFRKFRRQGPALVARILDASLMSKARQICHAAAGTRRKTARCRWGDISAAGCCHECCGVSPLPQSLTPANSVNRRAVESWREYQ